MPDAPDTVSGRRLLPLFLMLAVVVVVLALVTIRRPEGMPPAEEGNRPFGPVTHDELRDMPLIHRGSGGLEPTPRTSPAGESRP